MLALFYVPSMVCDKSNLSKEEMHFLTVSEDSVHHTGKSW